MCLSTVFKLAKTDGVALGPCAELKIMVRTQVDNSRLLLGCFCRGHVTGVGWVQRRFNYENLSVLLVEIIRILDVFFSLLLTSFVREVVKSCR